MHSASQRPQGQSFSQLHFTLKATDLSWLLPGQGNILKWCLLTISSFLSPQREPWFPGAVFSFKSCKDQLIPFPLISFVVLLRIATCLQVTYSTDFQVFFGNQGCKFSFHLLSLASSPSVSYLPCIYSEPWVISKVMLCLYFCTFCSSSFLKINSHFLETFLDSSK